MKISVRVLHDGKVFECEAVLQEVALKQSKRGIGSGRLDPPAVVKPSGAINTLYQQGFFAVEKDLGGVMSELKSAGYNFSSPSILMALKARGYLQKKGNKGAYRFIQKYPCINS